MRKVGYGTRWESDSEPGDAVEPAEAEREAGKARREEKLRAVTEDLAWASVLRRRDWTYILL